MYWVNKTSRKIVLINRDTDTEEVFWPTPPEQFVQILNKEIGEGPLGVPLYLSTYGDLVEKLPPLKDVNYIVSRIVAAACPRKDFYFVTDIDTKRSSSRVIYAHALTRSVGRKEWESYVSYYHD